MAAACELFVVMNFAFGQSAGGEKAQVAASFGLSCTACWKCRGQVSYRR